MHYFILLIQHLYYRILHYFKPTQYFKKSNTTEENFIPYTHPNKKPAWVKKRVMYLKVHLPYEGCRKIASSFNQMYVDKEVSVSKSYVYRLLKEHGYEIVRIRKEMRNRVPYKQEKNQLWQLDLTTLDKQQIFGVLDSGTRALLVLKRLPTKSTVNILITLLEIIKLYGKPQCMRSDNERVFTSILMSDSTSV